MTRDNIEAFYKRFFNEHNVGAAIDYVQEHYIQHNPGLPSGRTALIEAFREKFKTERDFHLDIEHIIIENDMVVVHAKNTAADGTIRCKVVDIYRTEQGKLAEHWDVIQKM